MIALVRGTLVETTERSCVVLTGGGVGYEIFLTETERLRLPDSGQEVAFFTQTVVREDSLDLYGFASWEERRAFSILLGVPKLGPRTALAMLAHFRPSELAELAAREDTHSLTKVPGIGAKSARRIILDLRDRLQPFLNPDHESGQRTESHGGVLSDTVSALISLGYSQAEAAPTVRAILDAEPDLDVAAALRHALKTLSRAGS
ncbi:MAG: Holliday junction branch migration protein RuvA [Deltaproteobacteria bacterium]|nr:Holliday junction branch migration protein RuvA [Deltaproteobacteria bacterium]